MKLLQNLKRVGTAFSAVRSYFRSTGKKAPVTRFFDLREREAFLRSVDEIRNRPPDLLG